MDVEKPWRELPDGLILGAGEPHTPWSWETRSNGRVAITKFTVDAEGCDLREVPIIQRMAGGWN
jgi:hypothetical protein